MKVLFASGDVGGARAILPVIAKCYEKALPFAVLDHGHISKEIPGHWERIILQNGVDWKVFEKMLKEHNIRIVVFASSLKDSVPLTLARAAKERGSVTVHVLDHWSAYRERMETDGLPTFYPDHYAVMDSLAIEAAAHSGIDDSVLLVTGQPALASLSREYRQWSKRMHRGAPEGFPFNPEKKLISFISEPVEQDHGADEGAPAYRGYTEKITLRLFCHSLQPLLDKIQIAVLPHPRENVESLKDLWGRFRGNLDGGILQLGRGRDGVFPSDGVAGMASILLYEAWLIGKPVISIQPGVRHESLRMLQKRDGVVFVESYHEVEPIIAEWVDSVLDDGGGRSPPGAQYPQKGA